MTAPQPPKTYGDQGKSADQIAALPQDQQVTYIQNSMSPEERDQYLSDTNNAWFGQLIANAEAAKYSQSNVQHATSANTEYVSGLPASNANYPGIDHTELKSYVDTDLDAGQVGDISTGYHTLSSFFDDFATTLKSAIEKSQNEWEGESADSARGYFTSLQTWADTNSQNSKLASEVTYQQSTSASSAKNNMPDPVPFTWNDEMKSWATSNPFDLVDNIQASMDKQQESQDAHDQAAQVMSSYDNDLYSAASQQPVFSEPPKFEATGGGTMENSKVSSIDSTSAASYNGPSGAIAGGGVGGYSAGGGVAGGGSAGSVSGSLAGLSGTGSLAAGAKTGSLSGAAGNTKAQGYQSPNSSGSTSSPNSSTNALNSLSAMPMAGGMGTLGGAGDGDSSGKVGRGGSGGFGPGGSGSGSGSAAGEGARTGARGGAAGAAEAAGAGRGAAGTAGRSGASGMGGAGRGGGKGGEDEEHQRPSWLVEADPDSVFGTDVRTAPPVIGE